MPGQVPVLGGDVLAIPKKADKKRAIKLIELLVAKKTQRVLAEKLFWAPVAMTFIEKFTPRSQNFRKFGKQSRGRNYDRPPRDGR